MGNDTLPQPSAADSNSTRKLQNNPLLINAASSFNLAAVFTQTCIKYGSVAARVRVTRHDGRTERSSNSEDPIAIVYLSDLIEDIDQ